LNFAMARAVIVGPKSAHADPGAVMLSDEAAWSALRQSDLGLLLTDHAFDPIYVNEIARRTLQYGAPPVAETAVSFRDRIRSILGAETFTPGLVPAMFLSGRRRYICRPCALSDPNDKTQSVRVAVILERYVGVPSGSPAKLLQARRRFHLSQRECETVGHLIAGVSTKDMAKAMGISPNTVKQFVRLVMSKMRVTTRSGIVSRVLAPGDYSISPTERTEDVNERASRPSGVRDEPRHDL